MGQAKRNIFQAEYGNLIDGNWVQSESGKTIDMFNPATGELLAKIQRSNEKDIDRAVRAAYAAFPKWSQTPVAERQRILIEMTERLRRRTNDYALMETLNNGKPLVESTFFDIPFSLMMFEQYIGAGYTVFGKTIDHADAINIIHREPIGVCAQIIPWNVPLAMMSNKVAAAMISGNTVVLKPAETVCLSVMEFFKEMADIIPPGVVNVVTGYGPEVGPPLVKHPLVSKAAFTGSVLTGRKVIEYSATNIIPVTMELGGKSANIVFPDADMDAAVEAAVMSLVYN
ncbi:MAG TPA: aldehyde dehydrogenase family protein, partial [Candidatus Deferrimicrobiaceae bacterium]